MASETAVRRPAEPAAPVAPGAPGGVSAATAFLCAVQQGEFSLSSPLPTNEVLLRALTTLHQSLTSSLLPHGGDGTSDGDAVLRRLNGQRTIASLTRLALHPASSAQYQEMAARVYRECDDGELQRLASCIYGTIDEAQKTITALERYASAMALGSAALEQEAADAPPLTQAEQAITRALAVRQYRVRKAGSAEAEVGALLFRERRHRGRGTRAWEVVRHPVHIEQNYTLASFMHHHLSPTVNAEMSAILGGQLTTGLASAASRNLHVQTNPLLPPLRPHRHGFAFRDGIYIGFMHDGDEHGGAAYEPLWRAYDEGKLDCAPRRLIDASSCARWRDDTRVLMDAFLPYDQVDALLPPSYAVGSFMPYDAAPAMLRDSVATTEWERLRCKYVDYVMACQWGDPMTGDRQRREEHLRRSACCDDLDANGAAVSGVLYAMLGRLFFPANRAESNAEHALNTRLDSWEVAPLLIGRAGSGKSTLGGVVTRYMQPIDVGMLSNRSEENFWGQTLCDKRIVTALELKKSCNFDPAALQMAISGERMSIATKNDRTQDVMWRAPFIFAGNEMPAGWGDSNGAISRRILIFKYDFSRPTRPTAFPGMGGRTVEGELDSLVHNSEECATLLRKMYCAYLTMALSHGDVALYRDRPSPESSAAAIPQQDFAGHALPKAMHMWHEAQRNELNDMRHLLLDGNVWCSMRIDEAAQYLRGRGVADGEARRAASAALHTPFSALCGPRGEATRHVRANTVNDRMRQFTVNAKDLTDALDEHEECGFGYVTVAAGGIETLGRQSEDAAQPYKLLVRARGACVSHAALRSTVRAALHALADRQRDDEMSNALFTLLTLLAGEDGGGPATAAAADDDEPPRQRQRLLDVAAGEFV